MEQGHYGAEAAGTAEAHHILRGHQHGMQKVGAVTVQHPLHMQHHHETGHIWACQALFPCLDSILFPDWGPVENACETLHPTLGGEVDCSPAGWKHFLVQLDETFPSGVSRLVAVVLQLESDRWECEGCG